MNGGVVVVLVVVVGSYSSGNIKTNIKEKIKKIGTR